MKLSKELIRQVVLYGIIGGGCALLDFVVFYLLFHKVGMNEFLANILSVHLGILCSFLLNRKYNFKKTDHVARRGLSFYLTGLFGLALSEGLLWLGGQLGFAVLLVKLFATGAVALVQFIINRTVAFGK